jgi:hypothetical protein
VNDHDIHAHIDALVQEEHTLFERDHAMTADERKRLGDINVQLDRLWDLLRQRKAREEFHQDPDTARERSPDVVEHYQQ